MILRLLKSHSLKIKACVFIYIFACISLVTFGQERSTNLKWDCSAIVYILNKNIIAESGMGEIIAKRSLGEDDAQVIQEAIDAAGQSGEIRILKGIYNLKQSISVHSNIKITGEGRGTVLIPPIDDFAFKIKKVDENIIPRPFHKKEGYPIYALVIRELTIDGKREGMENSGMGLYLERFWSSSFENLWIQNTNHAIHINRLHESDFSNIYMINNGNSADKTPCIKIEGCDNIHFSGLYVIYSNYIGMEITNGAKLVFISQSMFHGWLPRLEKTSGYPLIEIRDLNKKKEARFKSDVVIENSRITVGSNGTNAVNIINSSVTIKQCVATPGFGKAMVSATYDSRVNISDNSFYSLKPLPVGHYVLYAEDSEVFFNNNVVSSLNLQLCLRGARNSIIADNRFDAVSEMANIIIGDNKGEGSRNIQVKGNIFRQAKIEDAIEVSTKSTKNIAIHNNQLWSE